jgi:hypothetical protein
MDRRHCLRAVVASGIVASARKRASAASGTAVQLHMDLNVDPAHEGEFVSKFHTIFSQTSAGTLGYKS